MDKLSGITEVCIIDDAAPNDKHHFGDLNPKTHPYINFAEIGVFEIAIITPHDYGIHIIRVKMDLEYLFEGQFGMPYYRDRSPAPGCFDGQSIAPYPDKRGLFERGSPGTKYDMQPAPPRVCDRIKEKLPGPPRPVEWVPGRGLVEISGAKKHLYYAARLIVLDSGSKAHI